MKRGNHKSSRSKEAAATRNQTSVTQAPRSQRLHSAAEVQKIQAKPAGSQEGVWGDYTISTRWNF